MAAHTFIGDLADLDAAEGAALGPSSPFTVGQERIQQFADATDDQQWIHVDVERAASGPFGSTIAHGYLTLSLVPRFLEELVDVQGVRMAVNYGLNHVRFSAPVPAGARIAARVQVGTVRRTPAGAQVTYEVTVEAADVEKPVCVAQVVVLYAA